MSQNIDHPKPPISFYFISMFLLLFKLVYGLFVVIKWFFAPIMLIINIIFIIPFGRFFIKLPLVLETPAVDEKQLPDCIWRHFKEVSLEMAHVGFVLGKYIEIKNITPNLNTYFMSLVNHKIKQGAGVMVIIPKKVKLDGIDLPDEAVHLIEFTTLCGNQTIVDFTSQIIPDPFPFLKERQRIFVDGLSVRGLYKLFDQFTTKLECELPDSTISQLSNKPEIIIKSEFLMMIKHALAQNFVKESSTHYVLTWKGAISNGLRTVWPTSDWYKHQEQKNLHDVMKKAGMELKDCWEYESEVKISQPLSRPLVSLDDAYKQAIVSLNSSLETSIKLISIEVIWPEKQVPSFHFYFQIIETFPERKAMHATLVQSAIDNEKEQCHLHIEDIQLESLGYFDEDMGFQPLDENLSDYISYKKVLELIYQHDDYLPESKIVDMQLSIDEGQPLWTVYLDNNEEYEIEIIIHAKTGESEVVSA